jgi:hypothetical protein
LRRSNRNLRVLGVPSGAENDQPMDDLLSAGKNS